jgi:hypothetical protein
LGVPPWVWHSLLLVPAPLGSSLPLQVCGSRVWSPCNGGQSPWGMSQPLSEYIPLSICETGTSSYKGPTHIREFKMKLEERNSQASFCPVTSQGSDTFGRHLRYQGTKFKCLVPSNLKRKRKTAAPLSPPHLALHRHLNELTLCHQLCRTDKTNPILQMEKLRQRGLENLTSAQVLTLGFESSCVWFLSLHQAEKGERGLRGPREGRGDWVPCVLTQVVS